MDIAVRLLNGLLMIAMPIALGIYLVRRTGQHWKLFLVGAVLFVASQVLHIPFNLIVLNPILEQIGFGQGGLVQRFCLEHCSWDFPPDFLRKLPAGWAFDTGSRRRAPGVHPSCTAPDGEGWRRYS